MRLRTYTIAVACMVLATACGGSGSGSADRQSGPDGSAAPQTTVDPGPANTAEATTPAPAPASAAPLLLGSETVYGLKSGGAYGYFTQRQGAPGSDGFAAFSSTYADEKGLRAPFLSYKLTETGWVHGEEATEYRLDDDGATLTIRERDSGAIKWAQYQEIDVSGKPVTRYLSNYFTYQRQGLLTLVDAVFPPGSKLGTATDFVPKNAQYELSASPTAYQLASQAYPTSIAELLERATTSDPVCVGHGKRSALVFTGTATQGAGTVTAYEANDKPTWPCTLSGPMRATGSWQLRRVNGANILMLTLPGLDSLELIPSAGGYGTFEEGALITFNEINGKVVQGYFLPAVTVLPLATGTRTLSLLNPTAWNYVKARLPIK